MKTNPEASVTSPLPQEGMDNNQAQPTKITRVDVSDEPADTSAIKIMDHSGKQASAGTNVDDPGEFLKEFQKMVLCIGK